MPLRILFTTFNMPWRGGGTFYRAYGFARHLAERGHAVTLLLTALSAKWHFQTDVVDGVELVQAPSLLTGRLRTGWDPYETKRRLLWLSRRRYDLVHAFESRPVVIYPALLARQLGAKLVLDWCDWFGRGGQIEERDWLTRLLLAPFETFHEERFRRLAAGTTTINTVLRRRAIDLGVPVGAIHLLRNGADSDRIRVLDRAAAREALGLDPNAIFLGYLGTAFPNDARLMAEAFAQVQAAQPAARLMLIGNYKQNIVPYLADMSAVYETGYVRNIALNQHLAACDLLWLPLADTLANRGRWPMKLSDYMASGRAIVSTDVGDWAAMFKGDEPAGVVTDDDADSFAAATLRLLADEAGRAQLGANARRRVERDFAWPRLTDGLEAFYGQVLSDKLGAT